MENQSKEVTTPCPMDGAFRVFGKRLFATAVDFLISMICATIMYKMLDLHKHTGKLLFIMYYIYMNQSKWQGAIGFFGAGLKVVRHTDGQSLTILDSLRYTLVSAIIVPMTCFLSFFFVLLREDRRTLHDVLAGVRLVRR